MEARQFKVTIEGASPLLHHHDNLSWAGKMAEWLRDPENKKASVAGDDRTPAHTWIGNLYVENGKAVVPADNLMTMLREGGARVPTGKRQQTFKAMTQSGIIVDQSSWTVLVGGAEVVLDGLADLTEEPDFTAHEKYANERNFELFVKRAKIGRSKHVRVRPLFRDWALTGSVTVFEPQITADVLGQIVATAGRYCGLGDWRPSSPSSPGPFGKFTASVKEVK